MIREVIKRKYGINLSAVSVGRMLARLGFSCQKPLMRAYQQDDKLVNTWFEKEFPKIRTEAKRCKADLYFADEAGVRSDFHSGKTWALKGKTPIVKTTGARFGLNVVSGITPTGKMRFMVVEGSVNADKFIEFLNRLIYNSKKKVFLIVDGHPTHRSKKVKNFLLKHEKKIKLFFLPPYSPELNPDELVWNNLKSKIGKSIITGPDFLKSKVISHMRKLQKSPQLIRNFFFEPNVSYVIA
jgi:transposase